MTGACGGGESRSADFAMKAWKLACCLIVCRRLAETSQIASASIRRSVPTRKKARPFPEGRAKEAGSERWQSAQSIDECQCVL
jgi:hypothetical protein